VQSIFDRRVRRRTPGKFRTRVIADGVVPSLHVDYQNSRIKKYHKEGRAQRSATAIDNTRDFGIGKLLTAFGAETRCPDSTHLRRIPQMAQSAPALPLPAFNPRRSPRPG
jgi:hypothetical protein